MNKENTLGEITIVIITIAFALTGVVTVSFLVFDWLFFSQSKSKLEVILETTDKKDSYLEYEISKLKCEVRGGEFKNAVKDIYGYESYNTYEFNNCIKNGIEYDWENGEWINKQNEVNEYLIRHDIYILK